MGKRAKRLIHVGIDVSKDKLDVAWVGLSGDLQSFQVPNDEAGHAEIVTRTTGGKIDEVRIVMEATGAYHLAAFRALGAAPKARVMVIQPKAARDFARASMRRAKTDRVDAIVLVEFARRMDFVPTPAIPDGVRSMRALARHLGELIDRRAALKNQRHAAISSKEASPVLLRMLDAEDETLTRLIDELEAEIVALIKSDAAWRVAYERLTSIQGIKDRSVARILPELLAIPQHLTMRQCVSFAGLDPCPRKSGTSRTGESWPISKHGNARLRRGLYMVALTAVRHFRPLREFYERLRARNKLKRVALVAAMRKLLTALWAIVANNQPFDERKFSGIPRTA